MEVNNKNNKKLQIKKILSPKIYSQNSFNTFRSSYSKDKKKILSFLFKNNYNLKRKQNNIPFNYNSTKINENSKKRNSIKLINSTNFNKQKMEESAISLPSLESFRQSRKLSLKKVKYLKYIFYSQNSNESINNNKKSHFYNKEKKPQILNENKNNTFYRNKEDFDLKKRFIYTKFIQNKDKILKLDEFIKSKEKNNSLNNIKSSNYFNNFKRLRKNYFNKENGQEETINNSSNNINQSQLECMRKKNGIYLLSKECKPQFNRYRKIFFQNLLNKNDKNIHHNYNKNIYQNIENLKLLVNKESKKMRKEIKKVYSDFEIFKNNIYLKRPNENSHKGLEELFYLYNEKRINNEKKQKIIANEILKEGENNNPLVEIINLKNQRKNKKLKNNTNYINSKYMVYRSINKINKLFPDLITFQFPKLSNKKYIRKILYDIFIEFKNLLLLSMLKNKDINIYKKGIDFNTFYNCNIKIKQQGKIVAKKIFQIFNNNKFTKYMKLNNYIDGMLKIKDVNKENKLELFFELLNNNSDGYLTYNDIYKLSIICLEKITMNIEDEFDCEKYQKEKDGEDLKIVQELVEYFCKMIFKLIHIDIKKKIPIELLKKLIIQGGEQADYIEFLFGSANFT